MPQRGHQPKTYDDALTVLVDMFAEPYRKGEIDFETMRDSTAVTLVRDLFGTVESLYVAEALLLLINPEE